MLQRALFGEVKKFFLVWSVLGKVKKFFWVWSVLGKVKISRFFVKELRARYARFARFAPQPAFGRLWRALRWDKLDRCILAGKNSPLKDCYTLGLPNFITAYEPLGQ